MTFAEFFARYWWLMFPLFGMLMAIWGMSQSERQSKNVVDLIKSYTDQGKEPPAELLKLAARSMDLEPAYTTPPRGHSNLWSFFVFAALSWGFGIGWWMVRTEQWAFAFMIVAVTMGVLAIGALFILIFGRKG